MMGFVICLFVCSAISVASDFVFGLLVSFRCCDFVAVAVAVKLRSIPFLFLYFFTSYIFDLLQSG